MHLPPLLSETIRWQPLWTACRKRTHIRRSLLSKASPSPPSPPRLAVATRYLCRFMFREIHSSYHLSAKKVIEVRSQLIRIGS